jgi:2,4-dienoyl-CoA reductase-like NADH-dependent reductase (Old Yellow Enzyme family)
MSTKPTAVLFTPYMLGDLQLKNRIGMTPLTRTRTENPGKFLNELMAENYALCSFMAYSRSVTYNQRRAAHASPGPHATAAA